MKQSKAAAAVAWLTADPSRTQIEAALQYGITQGAVSAQKIREDHAIAYCRANMAAVDRAYLEWIYNPVAGPRTIATVCGISEADARLIVLGGAAQEARNKAQCAIPAAPDKAAAMQTQCALIAETIGGEYGAHIATAIRALPVNT